MHVTFLRGLIVPASYDECTALVKNDGASKHVWKMSQKVRIVGGNLDTVTY